MKSSRLLDGFDELGSLEMVLDVALKGSYKFGELGFESSCKGLEMRGGRKGEKSG